MKTSTDFRKTVETGVDPRLGEGVLYTMAYTGRLHLFKFKVYKRRRI